MWGDVAHERTTSTCEKMRCLKNPNFLFCEHFRQDVAGCFSHKHKNIVKTTRLESHSSLVDSFGWAAVIRACASATRWRRAFVACHVFGGHVENDRCIFSPSFLPDDVFKGILLVSRMQVSGWWIDVHVRE